MRRYAAVVASLCGNVAEAANAEDGPGQEVERLFEVKDESGAGKYDLGLGPVHHTLVRAEGQVV